MSTNTSIDAIIKKLKQKWSFDEATQHHTHTWHDREDFLEELSELLEHLQKEAVESKNKAYRERNLLVQALTRIYPAYLARHSEDDATWDKEWMWVVYVEIPVLKQYVQQHPIVETMQVSWHIHESERVLFEHLKVKENNWDGHTTEEKYRRLKALHPTPLASKE